MSNLIDSDFGDRLQQAVVNARIPYSQTAIAICLGVRKQNVDAWMKGTLPRADQLWGMADKFGVDARWLATGKKGESVSTHKNKRMATQKTAQKILAVLSALLDTDDEGVDEIVAAVEAVIEANGVGKQRSRVKRPAM